MGSFLRSHTCLCDIKSCSVIQFRLLTSHFFHSHYSIEFRWFGWYHASGRLSFSVCLLNSSRRWGRPRGQCLVMDHILDSPNYPHRSIVSIKSHTTSFAPVIDLKWTGHCRQGNQQGSEVRALCGTAWQDLCKKTFLVMPVVSHLASACLNWSCQRDKVKNRVEQNHCIFVHINGVCMRLHLCVCWCTCG